MKRTSQLILYAMSIALLGVFLPNASADGTLHATVGPSEPMAQQVSWLGKAKQADCANGSPSKKGRARSAHGFNLLGRDNVGKRGYCSECGCVHCGPFRTMCSRAAGAIGFGVAAMQSGQPLIDRHAKADWMAAQQAATRSWHAGYYHTQWGVPLALMAPPHARMQTRWGWGVAQSTMLPLYHQYKRPYPGSMAAGETGAGYGPLQPTPRWPSHTDQFGVYYIRGPW